MRAETLGPVVVVTPFDTEAEVVVHANDTPYGLNAMALTENLSRAHRVASALQAGTVWVDCFFIRDLRAPFGGSATPVSAARVAIPAASSSPGRRPGVMRIAPDGDVPVG